MNSDEERESVMIELCRLWPSKFQDAELEDFCDRLRPYRPCDICNALNEYKNTNKFRPQVSEILARLKGKECGDAARPRDMSFADVLRQQNENYRTAGDDEVILRYWRSIWFRYSEDAGRRQPDERHCNAGMVERFKREREAWESKCRSGCINSLCGLGKPVKEAERLAEWIFDSPDQFRHILNDLRYPADRDMDPFPATTSGSV